jgi:hypothetical protein
MTTIDEVLRPDVPTARATHLQQNFVMGWIPGEIDSVSDPGGIGRIKIRSDLLKDNTIIPNGEDCHVYVTEEFTSTNSRGGAFRFLQNGAQVALIPMLGDPTQLLMIGCVYSVVDQPSPEFDRAKGLYGSVTPGQVFRVFNDSDGSSIDARPTGAVQTVNGKGDIISETKDGARTALHANGTVEQQNRMASQSFLPDGTVEIKNFAKGVSLLKPDGTWEIKSSGEASLKLEEDKTELKAPLQPISQTVKELSQQLPAAMHIAKETFSKAAALLDDFHAHGDVTYLLNNLKPLIQQFGQFQEVLQKASGSLNTLKDVKFDDVVDLLLPQAEKFLENNLPDVFPVIKDVVQSVASGKDIIETLKERLPAELSKALDSPEIEMILDGLQHDKDIQYQFLSDAIVPDGSDSIRGILGMDMHDVLGTINTTFDISPPPWQNTGLPPTPEEELVWQQTLNSKQKELSSSLPPSLQGLFDDSELSELIMMAVSGGNPLGSLLGKAGFKLIDQLIPQVGDILDATKGIPLLGDLLGGLTSGGDMSSLTDSLLDAFPGMPKIGSLDLDSVIGTVLPHAMSFLSGDVTGMVGGAIAAANTIFNIFGGKKSGGVVKLTRDMVEVKADETGLGAKLKITKPKASLVGIGGLTELFAERGSAGVRTPWGEMGLGSGGGGFFSQAMMAFRVFQDVGKSAGFMLHPNQGASLASFEDSDFEKYNSETWLRKSAEISVDDGTVIIRSYRSNSDVHGIVVAPDGVYIEGMRVYDYYYRLNQRLDAFESRLNSMVLVSSTPTA